MHDLEGRLLAEPDDCVYPFQIDKIGVRGRLVRLGPAINAVLSGQQYPDAVSYLLGELIVLSVALSSALKFDGIFSLQIRGNGPIRAMVADFQTPGSIRAYASFDAGNVEKAAELGVEGIDRFFGEGVLSWVVDQGADTERHQGIVALEGNTLAECTENYFRRSEQLRAAVRVGVAREIVRGGQVQWRAGAIMVQNLASAGGLEGPKFVDQVATDEDWQHARALVGTATASELCDPLLQPSAFLRRLFHEDGAWVYDPTPIVAKCRCSRERIEAVLKQFPPHEVEDMVLDSGQIEVRCEFCNQCYSFETGK
ncbi:MAG: Hsp33 family molecular chaperone HslO [Proteobacteria bacterium]|nr:Hsp33 family molecular chaperone HslO [Pseudomonadota bacterium]MDA1058469.1 Hsp33 family molecular chaperone HslO [Pseudomonadota bacterium]